MGSRVEIGLRRRCGRALGAALILAATLAVAVMAPVERASAASPPPALPGGTSVVANFDGDSVSEYAPGASGNATPVAIISGSNTGVVTPTDAVLSSSGVAFVANHFGNTITEYAPGASGNAAPIATISGPNTKLNGPERLAFDRHANLFVTNGSNNSVTAYGFQTSGDATAIITISGTNTKLDNPRGLLFTPAGDLLVANEGNNSITEYAPDADGNVAPIATISGPNTQLDVPEKLLLGPTGNLIVANFSSNAVTEYAPGASGNATPVASISGTNTKLSSPEGLAFGPTGDLSVSNSGNDSITEFAHGATGNAAPVVTISGNNTDLVGPAAVSVASGEPYHPLTPARITDTRSGSGQPNAGHTLAPGATLDVQVTGAGGVPTDAVAVVLNVTATNPTSQSFLTVWPVGVARPTASNLNFEAGQTVPNLVEVGLGTGGKVSIFNPSGSVDVVVDVEGFTGASTAGTGLFHALTPARITDTRSGSGQPNAGHTLAPGAAVDVQITGAGGVPASGVGAAVLNVTATNPTAMSFLTAWPKGAARPTASNVNFVAGQTVPNRVMVPVGTGGKVSIFNAAGSVDVVVDVGGWFTDSSSPSATGAQFTPLTPARIADTRAGSGLPGAGQTLGPGGRLAVGLRGAGGVPGDAAAGVLNVTATDATTASFLTVFPNRAVRPTASDLNWVAGRTVSNLVVAQAGGFGAVEIFNASGSVDAVVDVSGWYA